MTVNSLETLNTLNKETKNKLKDNKNYYLPLENNLNIIYGEENIDSGTISIRKGNTIGYLKQNPETRKDNEIVKDILYESASEILNMSNRLKEYEDRMKKAKDDQLNEIIVKYTNLQEKFISIGGYELDTKIEKIISGFKINDLLDKEYNVLSGGEKRIVSLAAIMIKEPSILLLDEPTNHLDIDTLEWFEDFIKKYKGTILIVSHDRYFIDKVSTKTILIERGKEVIFHGNYSYYLNENEARIEREFKDYKDQSKKIEAMKKKIKQLEEWGKLAYPGGGPFFRRAENIRKRLERMDKKEKPIEKKELPINFEFNERSGKEVIVINNYDLKINDTKLINNINLKIKFKDKVCIMGSNGCGKSTLIKRIIENNNPNIKIGSNVKIGYIPQEIVFKEEMKETKQKFIEQYGADAAAGTPHPRSAPRPGGRSRGCRSPSPKRRRNRRSDTGPPRTSGPGSPPPSDWPPEVPFPAPYRPPSGPPGPTGPSAAAGPPRRYRRMPSLRGQAPPGPQSSGPRTRRCAC